jgi:tetratricopeptide (TPR) repeat protein
MSAKAFIWGSVFNGVNSNPKKRSYDHPFYLALVLGCNALVLLWSTKVMPQSISPGVGIVDLEEQLDIPFNNGIRGEDRQQADFFLRLGAQAQRQGNWQKAIDNWLQALNLYQQSGDLEGEGLAYDYLGVTYAKLGRYQQAEDALRRRIGVARTRQDFQGQIFGLNNLGTLLLEAGNPESARKTFTEALTIAQSVQNKTGEGLSLSNLGLAAAAQGNYFEAIKRYESALTLRYQVNDPLGEANTRNNLGDAYRSANMPKPSLVAHQGALRVARNSRDIPNQLRALRGLVRSYSAMREYGAALKTLEQHQALAQQQRNRYEEFLSLRLGADINRVSGNWTAAQNFYVDAIALARALGYSQEEALLRNDLAQIIYYRPSN